MGALSSRGAHHGHGGRAVCATRKHGDGQAQDAAARPVMVQQHVHIHAFQWLALLLIAVAAWARRAATHVLPRGVGFNADHARRQGGCDL